MSLEETVERHENILQGIADYMEAEGRHTVVNKKILDVLIENVAKHDESLKFVCDSIDNMDDRLKILRMEVFKGSGE